MAFENFHFLNINQKNCINFLLTIKEYKRRQEELKICSSSNIDETVRLATIMF